MPASEFAGKWAVCPPVEITQAVDGPQSFDTETEAKAVPAQPTEPQAFETEDQALAFLDGLDDLGAQRRGSGWRIVPVRGLNEHPGPPCRRSVEEVLKSLPARRDRLRSESYPEDQVPDDVSDLWDLQIEETLADETFLAPDWRFNEVSTRASWRQGHKSLDRGTVAEAISRVVLDLEGSMRGIHPNASAGAVADFWESWQVQRHLARILTRHLQRRPEEESQVSLAFRKIRVSLLDFASNLRLESEVIDPPASLHTSPDVDADLAADLAAAAGTQTEQWHTREVRDDDRRSVAEWRRKLIQEYIERNRLASRKDLSNKAGYKNVTELYRWQRCDPRTTRKADGVFRTLLEVVPPRVGTLKSQSSHFLTLRLSQ